MKVCFIGHSGGALVGLPTGGSERQIVLLAVNMARRGHEVTFVVLGYGGQDMVVDGVCLRSGWDPTQGVRFVRALSYRRPTLRRVLTSVGADAYYARGFSYFTATAVRAAQSMRAVSLLALTSDGDLSVESGRHHFGIGGAAMSELTGRIGYSWFRKTALRAADCIVVQNEAQLSACAAQGLGCRLVPSILEDVTDASREVAPRTDAIWVGNVGYRNRRSKGLEEVARLAERLPEASFVLVGEISALLGQDVQRRLQALPNVEVLGYLSHDETLQRIAESRLVVNTSPLEGFSNVMLEGWALRKPAVSLWVDPDGLLSSGGLGVCAGGDAERMARELRGLLDDEARRETMGIAAREYVFTVHGADVVCERLELLVRSLAAQSRPSA